MRVPGAHRGSKQGTNLEVELRTVVSHHVSFLGTCVCSYPRTCIGTHVWRTQAHAWAHVMEGGQIGTLGISLCCSLSVCFETGSLTEPEPKGSDPVHGQEVLRVSLFSQRCGNRLTFLRGCPESQLRSTCFHSRRPYPLSHLQAPRYV